MKLYPNSARVLIASCLVGLVVACGSADEDAEEDSAPIQVVVAEPHESVAADLPAPLSISSPMLIADIPPPSERPPIDASHKATEHSAGAPQPRPSVMRQLVATGVQSSGGIAVTSDGVVLYPQGNELYAVEVGRQPKLVFQTKAGTLTSVAIDSEFLIKGLIYVLIEERRSAERLYRVLQLVLKDGKTEGIKEVFAHSAKAGPTKSRKDQESVGKLHAGSDGIIFIALPESEPVDVVGSHRVPSGWNIYCFGRDGAAAPFSMRRTNADPRVFSNRAQTVVALDSLPTLGAAVIAESRQGEPDKIVVLRPNADSIEIWTGADERDKVTGLVRLQDVMWRRLQNNFVVAFDEYRLDLLMVDRNRKIVERVRGIYSFDSKIVAMTQSRDGVYVVTRKASTGDTIWRLFATS